MGHQAEYRAAVAGKRRGNKINSTNGAVGIAVGIALGIVRRPLVAAAILFATSLWSSQSHAQAGGPFGALAGAWHGGGSVMLDDGSSERIRCRATYAPAGPSMEMTLTCASDAYKFNLSGHVVSEGGAITGSWNESSRNIAGTLQGRGAGGNFEVVASAAGFNANITLRTSGAKQSIVMRADSQFRGASIALSR
jgi:hypothetical protein